MTNRDRTDHAIVAEPVHRLGHADRQSKLLTAALLVAAGGFIAQEVAGVTGTPTIPPGLVAIVAAAAVVAFTSSPWAPLAGVAASVLNLVVFVVVGAADRFVDTTPLLAFVGAWLMVPGLVISSVAGTIAALNNHPGNQQ
jgi:hypothetical protein